MLVSWDQLTLKSSKAHISGHHSLSGLPVPFPKKAMTFQKCPIIMEIYHSVGFLWIMCKGHRISDVWKVGWTVLLRNYNRNSGQALMVTLVFCIMSITEPAGESQALGSEGWGVFATYSTMFTLAPIHSGRCNSFRSIIGNTLY